MTPLEAAQDALEAAIRTVYVAISHSLEIPLNDCVQYLEELSTLAQLRGGRDVGAWALTLEQSLGEAGPAKVRQALTQLAHANAVLEALVAEEDDS